MMTDLTVHTGSHGQFYDAFPVSLAQNSLLRASSSSLKAIPCSAVCDLVAPVATGHAASILVRRDLHPFSACRATIVR